MGCGSAKAVQSGPEPAAMHREGCSRDRHSWAAGQKEVCYRPASQKGTPVEAGLVGSLSFLAPADKAAALSDSRENPYHEVRIQNNKIRPSTSSHECSSAKQYPDENFRVRTSVNGTSRIRVTLSSDGSMLEVETEQLVPGGTGTDGSQYGAQTDDYVYLSTDPGGSGLCEVSRLQETGSFSSLEDADKCEMEMVYHQPEFSGAIHHGNMTKQQRKRVKRSLIKVLTSSPDVQSETPAQGCYKCGNGPSLQKATQSSAIPVSGDTNPTCSEKVKTKQCKRHSAILTREAHEKSHAQMHHSSKASEDCCGINNGHKNRRDSNTDGSDKTEDVTETTAAAALTAATITSATCLLSAQQRRNNELCGGKQYCSSDRALVQTERLPAGGEAQTCPDGGCVGDSDPGITRTSPQHLSNGDLVCMAGCQGADKSLPHVTGKCDLARSGNGAVLNKAGRDRTKSETVPDMARDDTAEHCDTLIYPPLSGLSIRSKPQDNQVTESNHGPCQNCQTEHGDNKLPKSSAGRHDSQSGCCEGASNCKKDKQARGSFNKKRLKFWQKKCNSDGADVACGKPRKGNKKLLNVQCLAMDGHSDVNQCKCNTTGNSSEHNNSISGPKKAFIKCVNGGQEVNTGDQTPCYTRSESYMRAFDGNNVRATDLVEAGTLSKVDSCSSASDSSARRHSGEVRPLDTRSEVLELRMSNPGDYGVSYTASGDLDVRRPLTAPGDDACSDRHDRNGRSSTPTEDIVVISDQFIDEFHPALVHPGFYNGI